eukprot:964964-Rhodomonas_salina.3
MIPAKPLWRRKLHSLRGTAYRSPGSSIACVSTGHCIAQAKDGTWYRTAHSKCLGQYRVPDVA